MWVRFRLYTVARLLLLCLRVGFLWLRFCCCCRWFSSFISFFFHFSLSHSCNRSLTQLLLHLVSMVLHLLCIYAAAVMCVLVRSVLIIIFTICCCCCFSSSFVAIAWYLLLFLTLQNNTVYNPVCGRILFHIVYVWFFDNVAARFARCSFFFFFQFNSNRETMSVKLPC